MFLPVSDCLHVESLFATSPLNTANTVLLFAPRSTKCSTRCCSKIPSDGRGKPTRCVFNPRKFHKYLQAHQETHPTVENVCLDRKQNKFPKTLSQFARPELSLPPNVIPANPNTRKVICLGGEIWVLLACSAFWLDLRYYTLAFTAANSSSLNSPCDTHSVCKTC